VAVLQTWVVPAGIVFAALTVTLNMTLTLSPGGSRPISLLTTWPVVAGATCPWAGDLNAAYLASVAYPLAPVLTLTMEYWSAI
jgi:hypothetical protein